MEAIAAFGCRSSRPWRTTASQRERSVVRGPPVHSLGSNAVTEAPEVQSANDGDGSRRCESPLCTSRHSRQVLTHNSSGKLHAYTEALPQLPLSYVQGWSAKAWGRQNRSDGAVASARKAVRALPSESQALRSKHGTVPQAGRSVAPRSGRGRQDAATRRAR